MVSLRSPTKERVYRPSNEVEVVCPDDAAVTEPAGLTARHELHQSGGVCTWAVGWNIYGEGDYLLTTDYVAIAGTDIPHAPWDALVRSRESLCHQAKLGQGKLFQLFHSSFFSSEFTLFCCKVKQWCFACQGQKSVLRALLCPQGQKRKAPLLQKATTKEVAVQVGCELELELWRAPDLYKVIPIKFGCKGTKNSRDYQGCAVFN